MISGPHLEYGLLVTECQLLCLENTQCLSRTSHEVTEREMWVVDRPQTPQSEQHLEGQSLKKRHEDWTSITRQSPARSGTANMISVRFGQKLDVCWKLDVHLASNLPTNLRCTGIAFPGCYLLKKATIKLLSDGYSLMMKEKASDGATWQWVGSPWFWFVWWTFIANIYVLYTYVYMFIARISL